MSDQLSWKASLGPRIPSAMGEEIDLFESQMELRKQGKLEEPRSMTRDTC